MSNPSNAAKAAALLVFTSGIESYEQAVKVYDQLEEDEDLTVQETLDKFPGACRWSRVDDLDDADWWEEVRMLAINIDKCRIELPPPETYQICYGNVVDGFTFVGPFTDRDAAVCYAENDGEQGTDWCIAPIYTPAPGTR